MTKKLFWPILIALLALVAIGVLLMGQQPELKPIVPVVQPATGGVYAEALIGSLVRLNPLLDYTNTPDQDVDRLIFSGLLHFDDRGIPQPDLAESWGISKDGMVYNFTIRSNAVWHDSQPVTSDDVIFTIERMREDTSPLPEDLRNMWKQVEIRRLDDKSLQFRLPEPFSPFLDYLTFGILPEHLLGDLGLPDIVNSSFNLQPVGSGPYRFDRLEVKEGKITGVVLSRFKNYYGGQPFIDQIAFRYFPDATAALTAYHQGEVMGISQVPPEILPQVLQEPKLNLHTGRLPSLAMVFINLNDPELKFFQDPAVRRALLLGLNRQWIVDRLLGGQAILADGPIFPGTWAYYEGIEHLDYDVDAAVELLKSAGYTIPAEGGAVRTNADGVALSFDLLYPDDATHKAIAEAIQKDWSRLGIGVNLKSQPYADVVKALDDRLYHAALVDLNLARFPDPDPYPFWHQAQISGGQNYSGWDDRQASEYLEQARVTADWAERTRLYRNFQVRFAKELPALPLYYPVYRYAIDTEVQGVRMGPLFSPSDRFATLTSWFLVTRRSTGQEATATPTTTAAP